MRHRDLFVSVQKDAKGNASVSVYIVDPDKERLKKSTVVLCESGVPLIKKPASLVSLKVSSKPQLSLVGYACFYFNSKHLLSTEMSVYTMVIISGDLEAEKTDPFQFWL